MRHKVLMVYPLVGFSGNFVKHPPLSLIYASSELVKHEIEVEILDNRLYKNSWKEELKKRIKPDVLVVGLSVMSGTPIENAIEVGRFVKSVDKDIKIVWGGPHATFYPESILEEKQICNYVISGYGSKPFYKLIRCLLDNKEPLYIQGLSYWKDNKIRQVPYKNRFEFIDHKDIPYDLINDYSVYGQLESKEIIFPMYSALGCPYQCSFCSSPAQYKKFKKSWVLLDVCDVVDHISYVIEKYQANYIYFIDDDSFVDLKHVENIMDEIHRRKIKVKLGFRGARINEIKKMSDNFISKLISTGTDILHIGAESGSDRILKLLKKNCTVEEIIECNKKLARHPKIRAAYNFIIGIPTETMEDIKATRNLMLKLVEDNTSCIIFQPNKYRPLPGTKLFELVREKWHYSPPQKLKEWVNIEVEGDFTNPWYPKGMKEFCDLLLVASYFIDNKVVKLTSGKTFLYKLFRFLNAVYGPIARFRLKHGIWQGLIEYKIYKSLTKLVNI